MLLSDRFYLLYKALIIQKGMDFVNTSIWKRLRIRRSHRIEYHIDYDMTLEIVSQTYHKIVRHELE
jgi:hypothetical protein